MNKNKYLYKYLFYLSIITPAMLLFLELSLGTYYRYRNVVFPRPLGGALKYDPISGWRGYISHEPETDSINPITFDHNGLVYNPYENADTRKNGIIILGDSVAQGVLSSGNQYNFPSNLQKIINNNDLEMNVKNLSFSSFNSWMEHTELMRYLNNYEMYDDLPTPNIIISFGGIQDFWRLIKKINQFDQLNQISYLNANNLMLSEQNIDYALKATSAREGNIKDGFQVMSTSLKLNWLKFSGIANLIREAKDLLSSKSNPKSLLDIKEINYSKMNIIKIDTFLGSDHYKFLVDSVTSSVERNIRSSIGATPKSDYVYVYSPTKFSSPINIRIDSEELINLSENQSLDLYTLKLIERDYRNSLLKKLLKIEELTVLDFSQLPEQNPKVKFNDYSHFSDQGNLSIAKELYSELLQNGLLESYK